MALLKYAPRFTTNSETGRQDSTWIPAVDIIEGKDGFTLEFDLPGFTKEAFKISVENDVLTVHGERKLSSSEDTKLYRFFERPSGVFERSFRLPDYLDGGTIAASYENGVLKLEIPRKLETKPVTIPVK